MNVGLQTGAVDQADTHIQRLLQAHLHGQILIAHHFAEGFMQLPQLLFCKQFRITIQVALRYPSDPSQITHSTKNQPTDHCCPASVPDAGTKCLPKGTSALPCATPVWPFWARLCCCLTLAWAKSSSAISIACLSSEESISSRSIRSKVSRKPRNPGSAAPQLRLDAGSFEWLY